MEDASAEDLDWFWRGWFYSIDACDIAIETVKHVVIDSSSKINSNNVTGVMPTVRSIDKPIVNSFEDISKIRNRNDKSITFLTDADTSLRDFYWKYDRGIIAYDSTIKFSVPNRGGAGEIAGSDEKAKYANTHLYEISFANKGGLIMPILVRFNFDDGSYQDERIPAQVWRLNENKVTKVFMTNKAAVSIKLDPMRETADIDESNNSWPKVDEPTKFQLFKAGNFNRRNPPAVTNPMQKLSGK
jgi:hypothetical protein